MPARNGKPRALDGRDARLLRALGRAFRGGKFDASNISGRACHDPDLMAALGFLDVAPIKRRRSLNYLTTRSERAVRRWLDEVVDREVDGLRLERDWQGWCTVVPTMLWIPIDDVRAVRDRFEVVHWLAEVEPMGSA
jgi:hypothetical protein